MDDLNYCFQLVRTMKKFEKENRHQLYVFIEKTTINSAKCATTSLTVHLHRHDVSTVLLDNPIKRHGAYYDMMNDFSGYTLDPLDIRE